MRIFSVILILIIHSIGYSQGENFEWKERHIRDDLYITRNIEIEQNLDFEELNNKMVESLNSYAPEFTEGRVQGVTYEQAYSVMKNLMSHPIYLQENQDYDTDRKLGLCFGRATYLHLELIRHGANKDSIKKIFVVGPMSTGASKIWQFHVATLVKDSITNQWWTLDTNVGRPLKVEQWTAHYKRSAMDKTFRLFRSPLVDRTKSLRFYVTEPEKIGPSSWEYNIRPGGLFHENYNYYFKDMFRYFKNNPVASDQKFNSNQCGKLF